MTEQKQGKHEGEQNVQNGCYNRNGNGITVKDPIRVHLQTLGELAEEEL